MTKVAPANLSQAALLFHALSDETRLRILERLKEGEQCVCDLTEAFKASQSRLSFHLKVLKDAGLVSDRRDGRWVYYALNQDAVSKVAEVAAWLSDSSARLDLRRRCR